MDKISEGGPSRIEELQSEIDKLAIEFDKIKKQIFDDPELVELKNLERSLEESTRYSTPGDNTEATRLHDIMIANPRYEEYENLRRAMKDLQRDINLFGGEIENMGGRVRFSYEKS